MIRMIQLSFFMKLYSNIDLKKRNNITIILVSDIHIKLGSDNIGYEGVMRKHGLKNINENWELQILAHLNVNITERSIFLHIKDCTKKRVYRQAKMHKSTLISFILARNLEHFFRMYTFLQVILDSFHFQLISKINLKL